jgi:hypothetical protein
MIDTKRSKQHYITRLLLLSADNAVFFKAADRMREGFRVHSVSGKNDGKNLFDADIFLTIHGPGNTEPASVANCTHAFKLGLPVWGHCESHAEAAPTAAAAAAAAGCTHAGRTTAAPVPPDVFAAAWKRQWRATACEAIVISTDRKMERTPVSPPQQQPAQLPRHPKAATFLSVTTNLLPQTAEEASASIKRKHDAISAKTTTRNERPEKQARPSPASPAS